MPTKKTKKLIIDLNVQKEGIVSRFLSKKTQETEYNPEDIELLRKLFSNEKTRILYVLKKKKPSSIYALSKYLKRDFKSVYSDLKLLERFGIIEFYSEKRGNRESFIPSLIIDSLQLELNI